MGKLVLAAHRETGIREIPCGIKFFGPIIYFELEEKFDGLLRTIAKLSTAPGRVATSAPSVAAFASPRSCSARRGNLAGVAASHAFRTVPSVPLAAAEW